MGHPRRKSIQGALLLVALSCVAHVDWSPARAADEPDAAEWLTVLSQGFPASLPNHVVVQSKMVWLDGVRLTNCEYHGDDRKSLVRSTAFSIHEQDGKRVTTHSTTVALDGGTWLAEAARSGPFTPGTDSLSIEKRLTQRDTWRLPADLDVQLRQGAVKNPLPSFRDGAIAFGYMVPSDGRRLWDRGPDDRVTVHRLRAKIGDFDTIAVRIESPSDVRTFWLEPSRKMILREILLEANPSGPSPQVVRRRRLHSFRFDHATSPPAILGFVVDGGVEGPPAFRFASPEEFTIDRRPDRGGPPEQDFRNAVDIPDGTAVRVDGLGLNSHVWKDGLVHPTGRRAIATP